MASYSQITRKNTKPIIIGSINRKDIHIQRSDIVNILTNNEHTYEEIKTAILSNGYKIEDITGVNPTKHGKNWEIKFCNQQAMEKILKEGIQCKKHNCTYMGSPALRRNPNKRPIMAYNVAMNIDIDQLSDYLKQMGYSVIDIRRVTFGDTPWETGTVRFMVETDGKEERLPQCVEFFGRYVGLVDMKYRDEEPTQRVDPPQNPNPIEVLQVTKDDGVFKVNGKIIRNSTELSTFYPLSSMHAKEQSPMFHEMVKTFAVVETAITEGLNTVNAVKAAVSTTTVDEENCGEEMIEHTEMTNEVEGKDTEIEKHTIEVEEDETEDKEPRREINEEGTGVSDTETLTMSEDEHLIIDTEASEQEETMDTEQVETLHQKRRKSGRPASSGDEQPPEKQAHLPDTQEMVRALVDISEGSDDDTTYQIGEFTFEITKEDYEKKIMNIFPLLTKEDHAFYTYVMVTQGMEPFKFPNNDNLINKFAAACFRMNIGRFRDNDSDPKVADIAKRLPTVMSHWARLDEVEDGDAEEELTYIITNINDEWD